MGNLSPATAAVLRAAGDSEPGIYATIAAALEAAALYCKQDSAILLSLADELKVP